MSHRGLVVVGAGYWGPHLVRATLATPAHQLGWLSDLDAGRAHSVLGRCSVNTLAYYAQALADPAVTAAAIATPAATPPGPIRTSLTQASSSARGSSSPDWSDYKETQSQVDYSTARSR